MQYKFQLWGYGEAGWVQLDDYIQDDIHSRKELNEALNDKMRKIDTSFARELPFSFGNSVFGAGAFRAYKIRVYDID